ncbi:MAG: hypothetical protein IKL05_01205 [Clostridia bacterium]|nr:hypothetical protein [Clostridia bacterium]
MKKKAISQRGLGSNVPAHLNDITFFNNSISNSPENGKEKFISSIHSGFAPL